MPILKTLNRHAPKRVVVKLGTGVLTHGIGQLDAARIAAICAQIAALRAKGVEVIIVSSGAVGLGMGRLGLQKKPKEVSKKQACAAVGQSLLMQTWQRGFEPHGLTVAQVLLTHDDLRVRSRYLGVKETLPPGKTTLNQCGEYYIISHNHALFQLSAFGQSMSGPITYLRVDPPQPNTCP